MLSFYLLVYHALSDKGHYIYLHVIPPVLSLYVLVHLCTPKVDSKLTSMCLHHQCLLEIRAVGNGKSTFVVNKALVISTPPF